MKKVHIIDLFCGIGGFSCGFKLASSRYHVDVAIDINEWAIRTYKENFPSTKVMKNDISELHSLDIIPLLERKKTDIIIASPPCEAFSIANEKRRRSAYDRLYSDPSGRNLLHTIRLLIDLNPRFFFIENVAQIATRKMRNYIQREFSSSCYSKIYFNTLEALNYGNPSARKRVFISNYQIPYPQSQKNPRTVCQAFSGLPDPRTAHNLLNHTFLPTPYQYVKKIPRIKPNEALVYFPGGNNKTFRNYVRLKPNSSAPTIMGKSRFIHPWDHRLCTVREHARLMSYSDDFEFFGPQGWQYNQVGESVPPILSKRIAELLIEELP
jgi:DNA (cytosine-5)-methyltransferase 1